MKEFITCDNCGSKKVVKNVQDCWVEYDFDYKEQEWSNEPTTINEPIDNLHYCQKCYDKWSEGDLF